MESSAATRGGEAGRGDVASRPWRRSVRAPRFARTDLTKGIRFDPLTLEHDVAYFGTDLEA